MKTAITDSIVIVGGGAGGLELACKLGRKFGRQRVTLVERTPYHIWKPSLHEVAAGTLDMNQEGLSYAMLAHDNRFTFVPGSLIGLDLAHQEITVAAFEAGRGELMLPERRLGFSRLCIAVGSTSNYYDTPGAATHTLSLDSPAEAEHFRLEMMKQMLWAEHRKAFAADSAMELLIIGGGATGVELAAELREASRLYSEYGFHRLNPLRDIRITLLERASRILSPLPERVSEEATRLLKARNVTVLAGCQVARIEANRVTDQAGRAYPFDLCVWAAGIKAPDLLTHLGLPTNRHGQLEVSDRLSVQGHPNIYAFGDCAACPQTGGKFVPPRAQAAHQQAEYLYQTFSRLLRGRPLPDEGYVYRDRGSLVCIGTQTSVGSLMGRLTGGSWFVEGLFARWLYMSLHLMHYRTVIGGLRTAGLAIARMLIRRSTARVKLH